MDTPAIPFSRPAPSEAPAATPDTHLTPGLGRVAIVTGATGFIGGAVASRLRDRGWRVRGITRPGSRKSLPAGVERVEARLVADEVTAALGRADVVIHLAGLVKAATPSLFRIANVDGTRETAEAASRLGARFVHVSSHAVAGPAPAERPSLENDPPNPITSYGVSKQQAEDVVRSATELRWTILRPSAVYGGGDRAFLPLFRLARLGLFPLIQDPRVQYTLVHVDDVARAVEVAATSESAVGEAFFVGHPAPVAVGEMMAALAGVFGRRYRPVTIPSGLIWAAAMLGQGLSRCGWPQPLDGKLWRDLRAGGFVCSVGKARRVLGFEAAINLAEGLARTARWYVEHRWVGPVSAGP